MFETAEIPEKPWLLPRLWGLFSLLLVASTFGLWFPVSAMPGMPMIPLVPFGTRLPSVCYILASIVLVIALLAVVLFPIRCRKLWWLVAASLLVSFLLDQHRLQPWAYQSAIYALVFAAMDQPKARAFLIPLAASVYLYSAAGKFDFQFAHTVGQDFLDALAKPFGSLPDQLNLSARAKFALVFPAMEFLAGLGLLFRRTRPFAAVVVMLMHASLIAILGPWGLNHSTGVLVWNALLIVQAYLLMFKSEPRDSTNVDLSIRRPAPQSGRSKIASLFAGCVVLVALIAPLWERSGYWDHWLSWSLYSPHTSRVDIELHRSAIARLDPDLQSFVEEDDNENGWQKLAIEQWSLESRGVPIYPQARYQLALAAELAIQCQLEDPIRVRVRGVADRWTGRRSEQLLIGRREIQSGLNSFWLTNLLTR